MIPLEEGIRDRRNVDAERAAVAVRARNEGGDACWGERRRVRVRLIGHITLVKLPQVTSEQRHPVALQGRTGEMALKLPGARIRPGLAPQRTQE